MLRRLFIAISNHPAFKKALWRLWYNYLASSQKSRGWTFMNYGFAAAGPPSLRLHPPDEPDRTSIQLYHHVVGPVDLAGKTVLEVGCGRGGGSSFLQRYHRPARMVGVDLSPKAVAFCRSKHRAEGLEFKVGDAEGLPFPDASVDAVVNVESSHCYPSFGKFLAEVHRVLRPGGHFLYADFRDRPEVGPWRDAIREAGFSTIQETDISPNVVAALDADNERKLALIRRLIPRVLHPSFLEFAAVRGTPLFEAFKSGALVYMSFILRGS